MKIKTNDQVRILTGKDKGKTGKVLQVFTATGRASVEGLNLSIKHLRPRRQGEKGQRVEFPAALDMSNLMLVCPKCGQPTRLAHASQPATAERPASKARSCKKCHKLID